MDFMPSRMPSIFMKHVTTAEVPETDRAINAPASERYPIGRKRQGSHLLSVRFYRPNEFSRVEYSTNRISPEKDPPASKLPSEEKATDSHGPQPSSVSR